MSFGINNTTNARIATKFSGVETYEVVCFGSAISHRCTIMAARLGVLRDRKKKGDKLMSCPMLGRCGKYGMCCDGRNFDECDFYKRLLKEPRKRR